MNNFNLAEQQADLEKMFNVIIHGKIEKFETVIKHMTDSLRFLPEHNKHAVLCTIQIYKNVIVKMKRNLTEELKPRSMEIDKSPLAVKGGPRGMENYLEVLEERNERILKGYQQ